MADVQFHDLIGSQQIGTLDVQYNPADPAITLSASLPSPITVKGPIVDLKIDGQLFKGTAFSVGNTVIDVTADPQTADVVHVVGTPVYLVTASSTLEALRDRPIEEMAAASTDATKFFGPDGSGGIEARDESGVAAFEYLTTIETDTSLVASPDGAGGLEFRAETGGGGGGSLPPWLTFTPPPTTGWSWDNQGSSTITSSASKQYIHAPSQSALHAVLRYRTAPAAAPYNCDFALMHGVIGVEGQSESRVGYLVAFRDSGGKLIAFRFAAYDGTYTISVDKWTSSTIFSAVYTGYASNGGTLLLLSRAPQWLRLRDDGTDLKFYYSIDGEEWILFATHARGDFLTTGPNAIGFGAMPENGDCDISLVHYAES